MIILLVSFLKLSFGAQNTENLFLNIYISYESLIIIYFSRAQSFHLYLVQ